MEFFRKFRVTAGAPIADPDADISTPERLFAVAGGRTFGDGLYRIHTAESSTEYSAQIAQAFPELAFPFRAVSYDWFGRQFAVPETSQKGGLRGLFKSEKKQPQSMSALRFDVGFGDILPTDFDLTALHEVLADQGDPLLEADAFSRALESAPGPLAPSECFGYRIPLFFSGVDGPENIERTDMSVYWHITGQLRREVTTQSR